MTNDDETCRYDEMYDAECDLMAMQDAVRNRNIDGSFPLVGMPKLQEGE